MRKFLFLIFFASILILYLCAHTISFHLTRQIADMEEEKKLLIEQLEQNKALLAKTFSYPAIEAKALTIGLTFPSSDSLSQKGQNRLLVPKQVLNNIAKQNSSN